MRCAIYLRMTYVCMYLCPIFEGTRPIVAPQSVAGRAVLRNVAHAITAAESLRSSTTAASTCELVLHSASPLTLWAAMQVAFLRVPVIAKCHYFHRTPQRAKISTQSHFRFLIVGDNNIGVSIRHLTGSMHLSPANTREHHT